MDFSLLGLWGQMGAVAKTVVVILLGMSMYAIGIALERFLTYRRAWRRSLELHRRAAAAGRIARAARPRRWRWSGSSRMRRSRGCWVRP